VKRTRFFYLLLGPLLLWSLVGAETESFRVVVNASNPVTAMTKQQISRLFLKKETRWENGFKVTPVDQVLDSPTGASFSEAVHERTVKEIKSHWVKVVFSGLGNPPIELKSDDEVLNFVKHNVGAIGYVSVGTPICDGVKVLNIRE